MAFKILESKDPDALNIDYKFDLSDYLATGELVDSIVSVAATGGVTIGSSSITDTGTSITVWLNAGTVAQWSDVTVQFTTDSSPAKTDDRTFRIRIEQK
jgi:hypothetical protein